MYSLNSQSFLNFILNQVEYTFRRVQFHWYVYIHLSFLENLKFSSPLEGARGPPPTRQRWSSEKALLLFCHRTYWQPLAGFWGGATWILVRLIPVGWKQSHQKDRIVVSLPLSLQLRLDASLLLMESAAAASLIWWMKTKTPVAHCRDNKKSEICTADAFSPLWVAPLWSLRQGNFFFFFLKTSRLKDVQIELIRVLRGMVIEIWGE